MGIFRLIEGTIDAVLKGNNGTQDKKLKTLSDGTLVVSVQSPGYTKVFTAADWVVDVDWYILINHSLGTLNPCVVIRDSHDAVVVNAVEIVDSDNLKIWVPSIPDLRFDGTISLIKT